MENIIKAFNLFTDPYDDLRSYLKNPFINDGYYCASDAHHLIAISIDDIKLPFVRSEKPKIAHLLEVSDNNDFVFTSQWLRDRMKAELMDETKDETKTCEKCDGEGKITCDECGHDYDCPDCNGDGKITIEIPTGNKIPNESTPQLFDGVLMKWVFLNHLCEAAELIGESEIKWTVKESGKTNLFSFGKYTVLIMPMLHNNEGAIYHTITK